MHKAIYIYEGTCKDISLYVFISVAALSSNVMLQKCLLPDCVSWPFSCHAFGHCWALHGKCDLMVSFFLLFSYFSGNKTILHVLCSWIHNGILF